MKVYEESTLWKYLDWDNDIQRWTVRIDDIDDIPIVDAEPVRHGRWIICSDGYYPYCSECNHWPKEMTKFCPNCGAKMYKED